MNIYDSPSLTAGEQYQVLMFLVSVLVVGVGFIATTLVQRWRRK